MKLGKGVNELSFGGPDTPQRNRNNLPYLLRAEVFVKGGNISNKTTMRKRLDILTYYHACLENF